MSWITINETKCRKDGICAAACPLGIINPPDANRLPTETKDAEKLCIRCGHCMATCPHGAISFGDMKAENLPKVNGRMLPSTAQAQAFLRSRRSIRTYKDKSVDRKTLARIIDIARYAPSGSNAQPVEWMVIYDRNNVNKYAAMVIDWIRYIIREHAEAVAGLHMDRIVKAWDDGSDWVCRNAPHIIIVHGAVQDQMIQNACTIALTYLELAASALKLGACWAGYFSLAVENWPPLNKALDFPVGNKAFGTMLVGYPKYKYHRIPLRNEPKIIWK